MSRTSRNRKRRNLISNLRLPLSSSRYVTLPTNHLEQLQRSIQIKKNLLISPNTVRRTFARPAPARPARTPRRNKIQPVTAVKAVARSAAQTQPVTSSLICVNRKQREEVMHALGHAGRGGQKTPRWTQKSLFFCKRSR